MVLSDEGQTLSDELIFHFFTTNDDLHPGLQVKNAAIRLDAMGIKIGLFDCLPISQGHLPAVPYPQRVKTFWDAGYHLPALQSVRFTQWDPDVILVLLKVKFCCIRRCPDGEKEIFKRFNILLIYMISACFYVQASDLRRFQMMIRVPVFPSGGELIASTSRRSSFRVLNGEYCRMSCRLVLSLSLTQGRVDIKGESSRTFVQICVFQSLLITLLCPLFESAKKILASLIQHVKDMVVVPSFKAHNGDNYLLGFNLLQVGLGEHANTTCIPGLGEDDGIAAEAH